jgi:gliding motility-associated protein GldL
MGFSIGEMTQTRGWKNFMSKVYGIGAAVVLVGAMFKIMHWPGSGMMLVVGLTTEAFIFFTSAFEPLHTEYDWSLVYPELAGMHDDIEDSHSSEKKIDPKKTALEKFDELINNAQITPELFEKLGNGLRNMNTTVEKLADVSDATVATNNYVANFEKASTKVNEFADAYGKSAQSLNTSAESLASTYMKSSEMVANSASQFTDHISKSGQEIASSVSQAGKSLADSYSKLTETLNSEYSNTFEGTKTYGEQLSIMTKNLTALNAVYELQLQGTNEHLESAKKLFSGMEEIMENMANSVNDVKKYREEVSKLGNNLSAMNTIYGNMLSAMNFPRQ